VHERDDVVGMDGSYFAATRAVLKGKSGQCRKDYPDPMIDCRTCKGTLAR
jgi:hypothetical protein